MTTMDQTKKHVFYVKGMHCGACELLVNSELGDLSYVQSVRSSLKNNSVEVVGDFGGQTSEQIAEALSIPLKPHGYSVLVRPVETSVAWNDFKIALPAALVLVALFVVLQKIGIVNMVSSNTMTYGTVFFVGIIASLSTCMAVVGGLVLSMSATFAKEGNKIKPQIMFHVGRVVSFFILGGVIGALGAVFTLSTGATFTLSLLVGLIMLFLGINLLDVFPWAQKLTPSMPKFIAEKAFGVSKLSHVITPLLVGVATFFLPCGFTQSMQLYTLTTGGFLQGALTMVSFALGTLPVLALVSFSSLSIKDSAQSGVFFKTAGIIVILFALFNVINSLVVIGLIPPLFNF